MYGFNTHTCTPRIYERRKKKTYVWSAYCTHYTHSHSFAAVPTLFCFSFLFVQLIYALLLHTHTYDVRIPEHQRVAMIVVVTAICLHDRTNTTSWRPEDIKPNATKKCLYFFFCSDIETKQKQKTIKHTSPEMSIQRTQLRSV